MGAMRLVSGNAITVALGDEHSRLKPNSFGLTMIFFLGSEMETYRKHTPRIAPEITD
jgi:hypothetical protein